MADVDPRVALIPKELLENKDVRLYFEDLERFLHDMWFGSGGGDDAVANENIQELYPWTPKNTDDQASSMAFPPPFNEERLGFLEVVVVTANYTTKGNEIVVCNNTAAIEITLNVTPEDRESVHVIRQNTGPVNVLGPALGDTSMTIGSRYWSPHFTYIQEISSWVVV